MVMLSTITAELSQAYSTGRALLGQGANYLCHTTPMKKLTAVTSPVFSRVKEATPDWAKEFAKSRTFAIGSTAALLISVRVGLHSRNTVNYYLERAAEKYDGNNDRKAAQIRALKV